MTNSQHRHQLRAFLRLLIATMRHDRCHRRMRHSLQRTLEQLYGR